MSTYTPCKTLEPLPKETSGANKTKPQMSKEDKQLLEKEHAVLKEIEDLSQECTVEYSDDTDGEQEYAFVPLTENKLKPHKQKKSTQPKSNKTDPLSTPKKGTYCR